MKSEPSSASSVDIRPIAARPSTTGASMPGSSSVSAPESILAGRSCPSPIPALRMSTRVGIRLDRRLAEP